MKAIKVLFVSRPNLYSQAGGDTVHVEQNRQFLTKAGVQCAFWDGHQNPKEYDLIHFFGLSRPAILLPLLKSGVPLVVSSIYVDYQQADRKASGLRAFLQRAFGQHALEYLKLIARSMKGRDKMPGLDYLMEGQRGSIQKILNRCNHLITASNAELEILRKDFSYEGAHSVVKLGTEHLPPLNPPREKKDVLCVARIEPLKNQLALIEAQKGSDWKLHIIGDAAPAHQAYLKKCKREAGPKVLFQGARNHEECASMFNKAKVHVLPSHYESTGLSSLEALHFGCQIVVNDHPINRELFQDQANFARVEDPEDLRKAINKALMQKEDHSEWLKENFSWAKAARSILAIYLKNQKGGA